MADHQNVLHFQHIDGELQHGKVIGVLRRRQIRDIAVDEEFPRIESNDLVSRYAAV